VVLATLTYPEARVEEKEPNEPRITQLLIAWSDGRREALEELMPRTTPDTANF